MSEPATTIAAVPVKRPLWKYIAMVLGVLLLGFLGVLWYFQRPVVSVDPDHPQQIIQADFIDLSRITSISKFRSGSGHDFSNGSVGGETCRSMKHYFNQPYDASLESSYRGEKMFGTPDPTTGVPIYSPVGGQIMSISEENMPIGKQFSIRPSSATQYNIRLFHVYPVDGIRSGMKVAAGQRLGTINIGQGTDISVEVNTLKGTQYFSYFQVMPDKVFAPYQARGLTSRDEVIVTKDYRDAHPLQCNGESFAQNYDSEVDNDNYVYLSGYVRPEAYQESRPMDDGNTPPSIQSPNSGELR